MTNISSLKRNAINNAIKIFIFTLLATGSGYFARIFLAKNISLSFYGLFYSVLTFFMMFSMFKDLGLNSAIIKYLPENYLVNKKKIKSFISTILWTKLAFASLISIFIILFSGFLSKHYFKNDAAAGFIYLFSVFFIIGVFQEVLMSAISGFQKPGLSAVLSFIDKTFFLFLLFIFFFFGFKEFSAPIAIIITPLLISFIAYLFIKKSGFAIGFVYDKKVIKKCLAYGIPLTLAGIGSFLIGYFDILMLTQFTTLEIVGIYSAILSTSLLLGHIGSAISGVVFPMVSEAIEKKNFEFVKQGIIMSHKYALLIIFPPMLIAIFFPITLLNILFSELFSPGSVAFQILLVGSVFLNIAIINISFINGLGHSKATGRIYSYAAILNVIGNFILIPLIGMNGAALMTTLSYIFMFLYSTNILYKNYNIKTNFIFLIKLVFSLILFSSALFYLKLRIIDINLFKIMGIVIISGFIYLISIFLVKLVTITEIKNLLK